VHGSVYALIRGEETFPSDKTFVDRYIFLPDITVFLKNTQTSAVSPEVMIDLDGTFMIPAQPQARYQLCWKAPGYLPGCGTSFVLRSTNVYLLPVGADALPGVVYGRTALKDGAACRFVNPMMAKDTFTEVTATISGGTRRARANSYGEFVLPQLPTGPLEITATCEQAKTSAGVAMPGALLEVNLTLPNVRPQIDNVVARDSGRAVGAAAGGSTIQVTAAARDGGGYPLHYRWAVDPPSPGFVSSDSPAINWTLPPTGRATIYVLAHDEMGGNTLGRVSLSTTPGQIPFSGVVTANDAPVVPGAEVTINGVTARTDAAGAFSLVLPKEEPRYVVTVRKSGYQMLSRALHAPVTGGSFRLIRAQDFVIDPRAPINVTERGKGEGIGVTIQIEAGALAGGTDGRGPPAIAPLHLRPATYNLRDPENQLPGNYGGIDKTKQPVRMQTFGATDIAIEDGAGKPFNLAPGKTALLRMPIDPAMLASAPPTIPVWHYDSALGMWLEDGVATKVGNVYETKVTHLSAVNMDLAFTDAACTIIQVDTGVMPVPFKLVMEPQTGGFTVDANHQNQIVDSSVDIVVREPPNIQVLFKVIDSQGNEVVGARQTVNTGNPTPIAVQWDPPPPPYTDAQGNPLCSSVVKYNIQTVAALFPSPPQGFLSFRTPANYLDPATAEGLATAYYAKIDPGGTKTAPNDQNDFQHWKTANGFDRPGEKHAIYENEYDLGFGRDMHMQTGGQDGTCGNCTAFYVTNYANVENAVSNTDHKATVAMEYSPHPVTAGAPYTKFYVFNGNGSIANSVPLDDFGAKYVPTLCIICHNGNVASMDLTTGNLQTSRFIGFDLQSFRFAAAKPQGPQEPDFKEMNRAIITRTNVSTPLKLLVTDWYGTEGDLTLPGNFTPTAVPTAWTAPVDESALYSAVVKTSCRSCHTTRDPNDTGQDISWGTYDSLNNDSPFVRILACSPAGPFHHVMPQAERTFARFWLSTQPNAPATMASSSLSAFQPPNNNCQ
jgi:hypothetical protein